MSDLLLIVEELKQGHQERFDELYNKTKTPVFYNILSFLKESSVSEDILQDTYVYFLANLDQIKGDVLAYLMVISRSQCLDYLRKQSKINYLEDQSSEPNNKDHYSLEKDLLMNKISRVLNQKEFEIFILRAINEFSFNEIAQITNKNLNTVLWIYNNSIKKIRKEVAIK